MNKNELLWPLNNFCLIDSNLWFVPYWGGVLCQYDLDERKINSIIEIPEISMPNNSFYGIVQMKQNLILYPGFGEDLCIYNMERKTFDSFAFPRNSGMTFESFYLYENFNNFVYLFPYAYRKIIEIRNIDNNWAFKSYECNYDNICDTTVTRDAIFFVNLTDKIMRFDCNNRQLTEITAPVEEKLCFRNILRITDNQLLLITNTGIGYRYTLTGCTMDKIFDLKSEICSAVISSEKIYLFPKGEDIKLYVVDIKKDEKLVIEIDKGEYYKKWFGPSFSNCIVYGNKIYVFNTFTQALYILNTSKNDDIKVDRFYINWERDLNRSRLIEDKLLELKIKQGEVIIEGEGWYSNLNSFLSNVIK